MRLCVLCGPALASLLAPVRTPWSAPRPATHRLHSRSFHALAAALQPAAAAVLKAYPTLPVLCLVNSGGIRSDIPAGNVKMASINEMLPFGST